MSPFADENAPQAMPSEAKLRQMLAAYGNAIDPTEAGPRTARRVMSVLADMPWSEPLTRVNDTQIRLTCANASTIVKLLEIVQADLAYGTQTETCIAGKLQPVIDELRCHYRDILDES